MTPEIQKAIQDKRLSGVSEEQIIADFVAAGHTEEAVRSYLQPVPVPVPVPVPDTAQPVPQPETISTSLSTPDTTPGNKKLFFVLAGVLLFVSVIIFLFSRIESAAWLSSLLGGAPYPTEGTFTGGLVLAGIELKHADFSATGGIDFVPIDENINAQESEYFDGMTELFARMGTGIPSEGYAHFGVKGQIDARNMEQPEFAVTTNADVFIEPLFLQMAVSVMQVDEKGYVRIDDVPALYQQFIEGIPVEQWIELGTEGGFDAIGDSFAPVIMQHTTQLQDLFAALFFRPNLARDLAGYAASTNPYNMLAAVVSADAEELFTDQDIDYVVSAIIERPVFVFANGPVRMKGERGAYYEYDVDIHYENLVHLFTVLAEVGGSDVSESELEELRSIITLESIDAFNRLTDMKYHVLSNGTFIGIQLDSTIQPAGSDNAIHLFVHADWIELDETSSIQPPSDIHPKTLGEIQGEQYGGLYGGGGLLGELNSSRNAGQDAAIKQSMNNMRSQAEISFNVIGFSYENVCEDAAMQLVLDSVKENSGSIAVENNSPSSLGFVTCNDSADAYAMTAPLVTEFGEMWCIDSTGYAGKASPWTLSTEDDYTCEDEYSRELPEPVAREYPVQNKEAVDVWDAAMTKRYVERLEIAEQASEGTSGITVSETEFEFDQNNMPTAFTLDGVAADRYILSQYRDVLLNNEEVTEVDLPIKYLAKDTNLDFTMKVHFRSY